MQAFGTRLLAELRGDRVIWVIVLLLSVLSVLTVYSSTGTLAFRRGMGTEGYLIQHIAFIVGGLFVTYICYLLHYTQYSRMAPFLLLICIPLLMYTLAAGTEINDARRWIMIPIINKTFQTSDFAKLALIIYVARVISSKQEYIKDFKEAFLPIIVPILIVCGLIAPADLSTSLLLFVTCMLMMFVGRVHLLFIWYLIMGGVMLFAFLIVLETIVPDIVRLETWTSRIETFSNNPDGSEQVQQSKIAIARGGLTGVGPGNSIQRN
ncbi:MAG: FtsW/RodA/SpoVE family cell cycle protein, partial [Saprospiraceae bacterium]